MSNREGKESGAWEVQQLPNTATPSWDGSLGLRECNNFRGGNNNTAASGNDICGKEGGHVITVTRQINQLHRQKKKGEWGGAVIGLKRVWG